jgi:alpha,alpha-trehalose phosphorylase
MIEHPAFYEVDPWSLREKGLDLQVLPQSESLFALSNGHIGLRGNLDEGEPHGIPGTYLNGFYETRTLPYAESGFGYPETADTLVNVTNGKILRLLVDDEPFDLRYGRLRWHRRLLDLRAGTLRRELEWTSPAGKTVQVRSTRFVSFAQRAIAAIRYEVEPVDAEARIVVQSELVANEKLPAGTADPRAGLATPITLASEYVGHREDRIVLVHSAPRSGLRVAAAMGHRFRGPRGISTESEAEGDLGRVTVTIDLPRRRSLEITKFLAYGWSSARSIPALRDQVDGALAEAVHTGWEALVDRQRRYLEDFWEAADVEIDGDPELQQGVRFALFHLLQASARAEGRPIPAKGLTGPGYEGHSFWDMETFVLHALTYTLPALVPSALGWRHSTLALARERARVLGLQGAAFPWRTLRGVECSGYWPAGTAAFHIDADIADAVVRYQEAVEDPEFERDYGLELLVETARLWRSLGAFDREGRFRIDGVTGPNEYNALADNNLYTNLMARHNLRSAAAAVGRSPARSGELGVAPGEPAEWLKAADAMMVPFDRSLRVHSESQNFTQHERWDFSAMRPGDYPLLLHFPYFHLYRKQVVKQADVVLALHLRGEAFTPEEKRRAFEYYEGLTVRDSSLSASTQAVLAAEVGHPDLAYDYLAESTFIDLHDYEHNVRDGLHMAALAGSWLATVPGLGGMRVEGGALRFAPRLPRGLERLRFRMAFRGRRIEVEVRPAEARYRLLSGRPLDAHHHQRAFRLLRRPVRLPIPEAPVFPRPLQPAGREPEPRHAARAARAHQEG